MCPKTESPPGDWLVRPTRAGRQAQRVWEPLTGEIEDRWQARFGEDHVAQLRGALSDVVSQLDPDLPDYLPVGELRSGPRPETGDRHETAQLPLPALMSKVLLAFGLDFQGESDLSLGIYTAGGASRLAVTANILRVVGEPVRVTDLPNRTGVAKMAVDNWLGALEQHGYLTTGAGPAGTMFRVAELTRSGHQAREAYDRWANAVEQRWQERLGPGPVSRLQQSAGRLAAGPGAQSLLWRGIEPYPDGWRAQVRRPSTLPHYPVVTHRGGFPDGS
jgi:DNA-binding MarR family transcriptional regulator